ncbi:unnamed protein product, partial [Rotaria sp. Silwood1]
MVVSLLKDLCLNEILDVEAL